MDITSFVLGMKMGKNGGSSDDVRYVTFMNGDTVLYVKPVAVGDDCVDVLTKGLITTPTKESTVSETYTYSGWSLTDGGVANTNALKNVTEDKTVYAAFIASVRYYTITYYDGDTVLKTESLAYGAMPSYTPTKDGFNFDGWQPAITTVTGDVSYYAQWSEALTFAGASWADIARISEAGEAQQYFKVGDTREVPITYTDGTTGTLTVAIAGFNHDTMESGEKAGISIICLNLPNYQTTWHENSYSSGLTYYYATNNTNDIRNSLVHRTLRDTVINWLPSELQTLIKTVMKECDNTNTSGESYTTYKFPVKLWCLSLGEIGYDLGLTYYSTLGECYEIFEGLTHSNNKPNIPKCAVEPKTTTTSTYYYWTRNIARGSFNGVEPVTISGGSSFSNGSATVLNTKQAYIRFGFCI